MENIFLDDVLQFISEIFDRFIFAFQRVYEGLVNEELRSQIVGIDWVIVLSSIGFVLFFLKAEILGLLGFYTKTQAEKDRLERIKFFIEHEGEDEGGDKNEDNDITIGRR